MRAEHLAMGLAGQSPLYNAQAVNNGLAQKSPPARKEQERRDVVSISPMQRANNMIEAIRKQKQNIIEAKKSLVITNAKEGKDIKQIEPMLDSYNELLQTLDEQIAGIMADAVQQGSAAVEKAKEKAEQQKDEEPKTEEELDAEHLNRVAVASDYMKQAETVASVKNKVEGEVRVKKSELELASFTNDHLKSKGVNVKDMIASNRRLMDKKELELLKLEDRAAELAAQQGKQGQAATAKLKESTEQRDDRSPEAAEGTDTNLA